MGSAKTNSFSIFTTLLFAIQWLTQTANSSKNTGNLPFRVSKNRMKENALPMQRNQIKILLKIELRSLTLRFPAPSVVKGLPPLNLIFPVKSNNLIKSGSISCINTRIRSKLSLVQRSSGIETITLVDRRLEKNQKLSLFSIKEPGKQQRNSTLNGQRSYTTSLSPI